MRYALRVGVVVLTAGLVGPGIARAAYDAFLNFGDIKGESSDKEHKDWITVESFSWGLLRAGTGAPTTRAAMRPASQTLTVTKRLDMASPKLMAACSSGRHFTVVTLESGRVRYELHDVIVSSFKQGPTETLTLNFTSMTKQYVPLSPKVGSLGPNRGLVKRP